MNKLVWQLSHKFHSIPIIDLTNYVEKGQHQSISQQFAFTMKKYGCAIVKDPRINQEKNQSFLNLMERFFSKRQSQMDKGYRIDIYPELQYEVGITPANVLKLEDYTEVAQRYAPEYQPVTTYTPTPLSKIRYLWNIGKVGPRVPANRPPDDFPQFQSTMNSWGEGLFATTKTVSELLALGLNLPKYTFTDLLKGGANKLAPNANDLRRCKLSQPFTGLHLDFNFLTLHGKCRYPGLYTWLSTGQKLKVSMPQGHLFVQAGKELEYITAGQIKSGYHEAVYTAEVQVEKNKRMKQGQEPWRISSTMFTHLHCNAMLHPLKPYLNEKTSKEYPPISQFDFFHNIMMLTRS